MLEFCDSRDHVKSLSPGICAVLQYLVSQTFQPARGQGVAVIQGLPRCAGPPSPLSRAGPGHETSSQRHPQCVRSHAVHCRQHKGRGFSVPQGASCCRWFLHPTQSYSANHSGHRYYFRRWDRWTHVRAGRPSHAQNSFYVHQQTQRISR